MMENDKPKTTIIGRTKHGHCSPPPEVDPAILAELARLRELEERKKPPGVDLRKED